MGFFKEQQEADAEIVYQKALEEIADKKDGLIHVLMINSFSKFLNQNFGVETKYTRQIDKILSNMQKEGFTIIDVKFNVLQNQGLSGAMEGYNTLITYKWIDPNRKPIPVKVKPAN